MKSLSGSVLIICLSFLCANCLSLATVQETNELMKFNKRVRQTHWQYASNHVCICLFLKETRARFNLGETLPNGSPLDCFGFFCRRDQWQSHLSIKVGVPFDTGSFASTWVSPYHWKHHCHWLKPGSESEKTGWLVVLVFIHSRPPLPKRKPQSSQSRNFIHSSHIV